MDEYPYKFQKRKSFRTNHYQAYHGTTFLRRTKNWKAGLVLQNLLNFVFFFDDNSICNLDIAEEKKCFKEQFNNYVNIQRTYDKFVTGRFEREKCVQTFRRN